MKKYTITYRTANGFYNTVEIKAVSQKQALFFFGKQVAVKYKIISIYVD